MIAALRFNQYEFTTVVGSYCGRLSVGTVILRFCDSLHVLSRSVDDEEDDEGAR
jgi:hypothetical protein